jgi:nitrogen fixation protein FixH
MTRSGWIPWAFAALFLPVLAVNGALVKLALSSSTGLVSDHAFETGQGYNAVIVEGQKEAALGWQAEATLTPLSATANARLAVQVIGADGAGIAGLAVEGRLFSPVDPRPDQTLRLSDKGGGRYEQDLALPRDGQWDVQLIARRGQDRFSIQQRLVLR